MWLVTERDCFSGTLEPPKHALHALTMHELKARHRDLMRAIKGISADVPRQADLRRWFDEVLAKEEDSARITRALPQPQS